MRWYKSSGIEGARPSDLRIRKICHGREARQSWTSPGNTPLHRPTHLVTSDKSHLADTLRVSELDTNLAGGHTLTSQLEDLVADLLGRGLEPRRRGALVWKGTRGDTLAFG